MFLCIILGTKKHEGKNHLENLDVDGRIILKCILNTERVNVDWSRLSQDRKQQWNFVNTVMKLRFHKRRGISWPSSWAVIGFSKGMYEL